MKKNRKSF